MALAVAGIRDDKKVFGKQNTELVLETPVANVK